MKSLIAPSIYVSRLLLFLLFLLLPICFGGVHSTTYLPLYFFSTCCAALALLVAGHQPEQEDGRHPAISLPSICLIVFSGYLLIHTAFFAYTLAAPPDLAGRDLARTIYYLTQCIAPIAFLCIFSLTLNLLRQAHTQTLQLLISLSCASGIVVAAIALSHWVSDNGRLFWIFEPEHIFVSNRARWPFVNANHLAHFLLIPFFIAIAQFLTRKDSFMHALRKAQSSSRYRTARFLSNSTTQSILFRCGLRASGILIILLAIIASISRGGWIGVCMGSAVFFFLEGRIAKTVSQSWSRNVPKQGSQKVQSTSRDDISPDHGEHSRSRRRRRRSSKRRISRKVYNEHFFSLLKNSRLWTLLAAVLLVIALLNNRGIELIDKRLALGLTSSKSEIRFQLYRDSLPMLQDNILFGVGWKNWARLFPGHMSESIAGINPVYLHSDPLELAIELGVVGLIPIFIICAYLTRRAWRVTRTTSQLRPSATVEEQLARARLIHALTSGWIALIASSLLDFPFRIPAIALCAAAYLGMLCHLVSSAPGRTGPEQDD